jgi:branched-chain amino acid transport system ATP-binding protein
VAVDALGSTDGRRLLEVHEVSVRFGGIQALDGVTMAVSPGEAVGLVGPNGAGKTTLFDCVSGRTRPDSGRVTFAGQPLDGIPVHRRARLGLARTFQRLEVFPELTVREHLVVADRAHRIESALWRDLLNLSSVRPEEAARVEEILALVGLDELADVPVAALGLGRCRLVELGRALACEPRLLLADEPSSGLDRRETDALADVLRTVQQRRSMAVLLVEHDLEMVARTVDRVVVLDVGRVIAGGTFDQVVAEAAVRRAYLGVGT